MQDLEFVSLIRCEIYDCCFSFETVLVRIGGYMGWGGGPYKLKMLLHDNKHEIKCRVTKASTQ